MSADELEAELQRIEARLRDGEERIAAAQEQDIETTDWEQFWLRLFEQYKAIYRRLNGEVPDGTA